MTNVMFLDAEARVPKGPANPLAPTIYQSDLDTFQVAFVL